MVEEMDLLALASEAIVPLRTKDNKTDSREPWGNRAGLNLFYLPVLMLIWPSQPLLEPLLVQRAPKHHLLRHSFGITKFTESVDASHLFATTIPWHPHPWIPSSSHLLTFDLLTTPCLSASQPCEPQWQWSVQTDVSGQGNQTEHGVRLKHLN